MTSGGWHIKIRQGVVSEQGMDEGNWLPILSGQRGGISATAWRAALWVTSFGYRGAVGLRNLTFDLGLRTRHRAALPVISLGNLTTGGTGKTPLAIWVASLLRQEGIRVCILSRGYRADRSGFNDEALELADRLPDVPQLIDADRLASSRIAKEELEMEVALLDDGFQHRQLARDFDLVLIDATQPFGYGFLLPRGLMREPRRAVRRADWIVITRANLVDESSLNALSAALARIAPSTPQSIAEFVPTHLIKSDSRVESLELVQTLPVFCFCGLGNPGAFFETTKRIAGSIAGSMAFPDHHAFNSADLDRIAQQAVQAGAKAILCSHKDLVKIGRNRLGEIPLFAVVAGIRFRKGEAELKERLLNSSQARTNRLNPDN